LFNRLHTHLADEGHAPPAPALLAPLTPKEHELYILLARHLGEPVRRADILRSVWDKDPRIGVSSNVVDVYILYLRQKLEIAAPHLEIATIRRVGYALRERAQVQSDVGALSRAQSEAPVSTTRPAS
ncbi:MAG TPA: helix-turn-helix domain-containing protein, partial [Gemmatimonadaceae bacterium]